MNESVPLAVLHADPPQIERTRATVVVVLAALGVLAFIPATLLSFQEVWLNILAIPFPLALLGAGVMRRIGNYEPMQELQPTGGWIATVTSSGVQLPLGMVPWESMAWISVLTFAGEASVTPGVNRIWDGRERVDEETRSFRMVLRDDTLTVEPVIGARRLAQRGLLGIPEGQAAVVCDLSSVSKDPVFDTFMDRLAREATARGIPVQVVSY